jgi:hypothetical protein
MVVRKYALEQVESKGLVDSNCGNYGTFSITQQKGVLENSSKRVVGSGAERSCRRTGGVVD